MNQVILSPVGDTQNAREDLQQAYRTVRSASEAICRPLQWDDYQVQCIPEVSPPKWHLAHATWFYETFVLSQFIKNYHPFNQAFGQIFNSYYDSLGQYHARAERHVLSRPTVVEVFRYREYVDARMREFIEGCSDVDWPMFADRTILGLQHEQQHQELLLMDIKRNFFANPLMPAYLPPLERVERNTQIELGWYDFEGGVSEIGYAEKGFCFDNETPRHRVILEDFCLTSRTITNGEYLAFVEDGGYADPRLWLSDGWHALREQQWSAPLYWHARDGEWFEMTLRGPEPLCLDQPVCHVSYYEADAFARWSGARLPTEVELEVVTAAKPIQGNFAETGLFHPAPPQDEDDGQWFGDVWEWTSSAYSPYPGYRSLEGALGEYNGKFMANQFVLKGGCCVTPQQYMRASYRNFFYPHNRWPFTGIRLANAPGA